MRLLSLARCSTLLLLTVAGCATEAAGENDGNDSDLREGTIAGASHPEVGLLMIEPLGPADKRGYCTATLIGPRTVLTAAHCFGFSSGARPMSGAPVGAFHLMRWDYSTMSVPFHVYRADANPLQIGFDMAIVQLDAAVPQASATPATLATKWPKPGDATLEVYGYGRHDRQCQTVDEAAVKRTAMIPLPDGLLKHVSCPGDSGGPYFLAGTSQIVATVKGPGLGEEWVASVVKHRDWILRQREAAEQGALKLKD